MDAETTLHGSSDADSAHAHGGSSVNQIRITDRMSVIAIIFSTAGFCVALFAGTIAWWEGREMRQVQIQLMYANAIMLRDGLVEPGDMVYGPEGNLEYRNHELKRKEK